MSVKPAKVREPLALLKSLIALLLIVMCIWAAQWQFQRGIDRHQRNSLIESQLTLPEIDISKIASANTIDITAFEWRTVSAAGQFNPAQQILLKNRYFEGVYGYEVLTRFKLTDGRYIWVDRGWVQAGATATTPPVITRVPNSEVSITGRFRLDSSLPRGSFFALPGDGQGLVSELNAQSQLDTEKFYINLLSGSEPALTPAAPAQLPPLSDGPHLAYALQWLFFGGLIVYGRILIRRTR